MSDLQKDLEELETAIQDFKNSLPEALRRFWPFAFKLWIVLLFVWIATL